MKLPAHKTTTREWAVLPGQQNCFPPSSHIEPWATGEQRLLWWCCCDNWIWLYGVATSSCSPHARQLDGIMERRQTIKRFLKCIKTAARLQIYFAPKRSKKTKKALKDRISLYGSIPLSKAISTSKTKTIKPYGKFSAAKLKLVINPFYIGKRAPTCSTLVLATPK